MFSGHAARGPTDGVMVASSRMVELICHHGDIQVKVSCKNGVSQTERKSYSIHFKHLAVIWNALRERVRPWYLRYVYFKLAPRNNPVYFSSCWHLPEFSGTGFAGNRPAAIFWPMNDWHTRIQRTQHLARELAERGFPVLYINPHLGREFPHTFRRGQAEKLMRIEANLLELHVHLPREPVFHHRRLSRDESQRIAAAVTNALRLIGADRAVQIAAFPIWLDAALEIRKGIGAPIIYDCHDYLPGFANVAPEIVTQEAELFRASDLVLCTSHSLMKRAAAVTTAPRVLLRNAAAADFFRVELDRAMPVTIGYAGALDSWFDADAVRHAADARPQWRFELIGRVENPAVSALAALSNVQLVGEIPFAELPRRLARFHVGIIPFQINPLIQATDPIKAYEYLACGLPVVASEMPELKRFGELVFFYDTPGGFVAQLDRAVRQPLRPDLIPDLIRNETWKARGDALEELIQHLTLKTT